MLVEDWESPVPSPPYYELEVLDEAVRFIFLKDQERRANKAVFSFEADGIEVMGEVEGGDATQEFIVVNVEDEIEVRG